MTIESRIFNILVFRKNQYYAFDVSYSQNDITCNILDITHIEHTIPTH